MKTKTFVLIAVLFSSVSIFAQKSGVTVLSNVDTEGSLTTKECIAVDKNTLAPLSKTVYASDANGNKIERALYTWTNSGWVAQQKIEYQYAADNKISGLTYTVWDSKANAWSDDSKYIAYSYSQNGELIAEGHINKADNLLSEK